MVPVPARCPTGAIVEPAPAPHNTSSPSFALDIIMTIYHTHITVASFMSRSFFEQVSDFFGLLCLDFALICLFLCLNGVQRGCFTGFCKVLECDEVVKPKPDLYFGFRVTR